MKQVMGCDSDFKNPWIGFQLLVPKYLSSEPSSYLFQRVLFSFVNKNKHKVIKVQDANYHC